MPLVEIKKGHLIGSPLKNYIELILVVLLTYTYSLREVD
jgi:hypothetical protein